MMRECDWCKSLVDVNAEICPTCGRIWDKKRIKKMNKKILKIIGLCFLLLFIVIIILAVTLPSVEDECKEASEITLKEVQDKMSENRQNAEATYNNNYYILNGKILHIYSKRVEIQDLNSYYSIFVTFDSTYKDKILDLKVGDTIKYCGKFNMTSISYEIENACIMDND